MDILPMFGRAAFAARSHDLFRHGARALPRPAPGQPAADPDFRLLSLLAHHRRAPAPLVAHRVGEDTFEYTGRGKELLIGFLIALAVLVPIYILYFSLALEAERLQAFASVPIVALLYVLGYYALYRARRYRATRTIFRGVRFWMTGSGFAYVGRAVLWDLLTLLSLGFAYAVAERGARALQDAPHALRRCAGRVLRHGLDALQARRMDLGDLSRRRGDPGVFASARTGSRSRARRGARVAAPFLFPVFHAMELRWWLEGMRIGPVTVRATSPPHGRLKCYRRRCSPGCPIAPAPAS